ncbi:MAG: WHG domain-containing protein, partial [Pseudomonadales bacterium]|nr:WHG domain-containing protein [Pseudomonadales bacterium]
ANARAQENMVDYVRRMIAAGLLEGDAQLIGYMFWASLHGIVVLDLGSGLRGMDGHTLREKIMRTLYAGMKVHPPRLDD